MSAIDLSLRPLAVPEDIATVHGWLTTEHARFWDMQNATYDDVLRGYQQMARSPHHAAYIGSYEMRPAFLMERYDPAYDEIGRHYPVEAGDIGMHFLVAPPRRRIPGFTTAVLHTVMSALFGDPEVRRVVVEPDDANTKVHRLNAAVGFEVAGRVQLPDKTALLSFCTRDQYATARGAPRA